MATVRGELGEEQRPAYEATVAFWQSYAGLKRYSDKRREAA